MIQKNEENGVCTLTAEERISAAMAMETEQERLREIHALLKEFLAKTEREETRVGEAMRRLNKGEAELIETVFRSTEETTSGFVFQSRSLLRELYELLDRPSEPEEETATTSMRAYGMEAQFVDGALVLQLPMLGSIWRPGSGTAGGKPRYETVFAADVRDILQRLFSRDPAPDREIFREKTISYFFVYDRDSARVMDSDNHSTKVISDAICSFFPGSDSGLTTSFFYMTCVCPWPPVGTYVVVSPGKIAPASPEILERFIPRIRETEQDFFLSPEP